MNASTRERASEITALFTDLYELTTLGAYGLRGMGASATFSLFVGDLPASRNFLIACGLDDLLDELEGFRFHEQDISYRRSLNMLPAIRPPPTVGLKKEISASTSCSALESL